MLQLSLVGPPAEPAIDRGQARIFRIVHAELENQLESTNVGPETLHLCARAVTEAVRRSSTMWSNRQLLIRMAGNRPTCWICGYRIDMNASPDSDGEFSIDHVIPRSKGGGQLGIANLKPAHRLCNHVRGAATLKPKRQAHYAAFLTALERQHDDDERMLTAN